MPAPLPSPATDPAGPAEASATSRGTSGLARVRVALRRENWYQLGRFIVVGASGYLVNLGVYSLTLNWANLHYLLAATAAFLVAAANNYVWNRLWTFRAARGHVGYQGLRFLIVSVVALGANLGLLHLLIQGGLGRIVAQALAIALVTPVNFVGNKIWAFR